MLNLEEMIVIHKNKNTANSNTPSSTNLMDPKKFQMSGGDLNLFISEKPTAIFGMADFKSIKFDLISGHYS